MKLKYQFGALTLLCLLLLCSGQTRRRLLYPFVESEIQKRYGKIAQEELDIAKDQVKDMFWFGYHNYMKHAYPLDELDPIHCRGRGPDYDNPSNININDILGNFSLTLVDSLTSLAIFGNKTAFYEAVKLVIDNVSFNQNVTVQVFETTIRILGSLLSCHMILTDENPYVGSFKMDGYSGELLAMTKDLAHRLLKAFDKSKSGLPYPRVNLKHGVLLDIPNVNETCTAGAGSLLLEFGILSKLLDDSSYEKIARQINSQLWKMRDTNTGLLGNAIDVNNGSWKGVLAGTGAGIDSFYEYLLKTYIIFGNSDEYEMFAESYQSLEKHLRHTKTDFDGKKTGLPFYANVDMRDGSILNTWVDSLQASFPGVEVLAGHVGDAIIIHAFYYTLWQKYEALPERFNWQLKTAEVEFYPLRPEFAESTYLLYMATKSPFYQHVGREIIDALNKNSRVRCGFATIHSVHDKSIEDRMESFFLSETCKYLYLLFDENNPVNVNQERLLFSTEGHPFPVIDRFHGTLSSNSFSVNGSCNKFTPVDNVFLPIDEVALEKLHLLVGLSSPITSI